MSEPDPSITQKFNFWYERTAILANGAVVPLVEAEDRFGRLQNLLRRRDCMEWDGLYFLREVCLGRPIDPEPSATLVHERLLEPDGTPDPVMCAVVLASVRGCGRELHLDSPFTDSLDRALAEFVHARNMIRSDMETAPAEAFIQHDPVEDGLKRLRNAPPPPEDRLKDPKSYVEDLVRRANKPKPDSPDGPPPPPK
ncbi:hypothetical protein [Frigoriglobus tundricola]|uniref:Uncharacterized protein n=1 Tax=Frigoriglobus tundricola TaxID=2774151 RepID=A0A6M5YWU3_9BACT|nr:hypothetical protein [Frigoriglobus tundricola]QJW98485.1 hypothetical protein FTUN_6075 [Frigoriglobus tundricola]